MKARETGFLNPNRMPEDVFDYIQECHALLWRVARVAYPRASGHLSEMIEDAIEKLERSSGTNERNSAMFIELLFRLKTMRPEVEDAVMFVVSQINADESARNWFSEERTAKP